MEGLGKAGIGTGAGRLESFVRDVAHWFEPRHRELLSDGDRDGAIGHDASHLVASCVTIAGPVRAIALMSCAMAGCTILAAGSGAGVRIYWIERKRLLWEQTVLNATCVSGIKSVRDGGDGVWIVFGQKEIAFLVTPSPPREGGADDFASAISNTQVKWRHEFSDWILDVMPLPTRIDRDNSHATDRMSDRLLIGFAHNVVELWDWKTKERLRSVRGEPCLLYSMAFHDDTESTGRVFVASGTIFSKIFIWEPLASSDSASESTTCVLEGHQGSVFGLRWQEDGKRIISVSDDRTIRLWQLRTDASANPQAGESSVMYGHSERVWDACLLGDERLASVSEDGTCRIWEIRNGKCLAALRGHQRKNAWRIIANPAGTVLITSGGDSTIRIWSVKAAIEHSAGGKKMSLQLPTSCTGTPHDLQAQLAQGGDFARRLKLIGKRQFVLITNKGFALKCVSFGDRDSSRWEFLHFDPSGAVCESLAASHDNSRILVCDSKGYATVINTEKTDSGGIIKWKAHDCKATACWSVETNSADDCLFVTSGRIDGKLKMWRISATWSRSKGKENIEAGQSEITTQADPRDGVTPELVGVFLVPQKRWICALAADPSLRILIGGDMHGSIYLYPLLSNNRGICEEVEPVHQLLGVHGKEHVTDIVIRSSNEIYSSGMMGQLNRYVLRKRRAARYEKGSSVDTRSDGLELVLVASVRVNTLLEDVQRILLPLGSARNTGEEHFESAEEEEGEDFAIVERRKEGEVDGVTDEIADDVFLFGLHGTEFVMHHVNSRSQTLQIDCKRNRRASDLFYSGTPDGEFTLVYQSRDRVLQVHSSSTVDDEQSSEDAERGMIEDNLIGAPYHFKETNAMAILHVDDYVVTFVTGSVDTTIRVWNLTMPKSETESVRLSCKQVLRKHTSNVKALAYSANENYRLLFSGGGLAMLECWSVRSDGHFVHAARQRCSDDLECRIMSIVAFPLSDSDSHCIAVGLSDGVIAVFRYLPHQRVFVKLATSRAHSGVVLSLAQVPTEGSELIISGGTDGMIRWWDLARAIDEMDAPSEGHCLKQVHELRAHQSGVNSIAIASTQVLLQKGPPGFLLVTGGDDQSISSHIFQIEQTEEKGKEREAEGTRTLNCADNTKAIVRILYSHQLVNAHVSSIKGVCMRDGYVFSLSIDQRYLAINLTR